MFAKEPSHSQDHSLWSQLYGQSSGPGPGVNDYNKACLSVQNQLRVQPTLTGSITPTLVGFKQAACERAGCFGS